jgi:hypothetical protein
VQHACVDLHCINLVEKIHWFQKSEKPITKYQPRTIQDIMLLINNRFAKDIDSHPVLQRMIDA